MEQSEMKQKRKKTEKLIIDSINKIDKDNAEYYKRLFSQMSDQEFHKFMVQLKKGNTSIHIYLPNLKKSITNEKIFQLADEFKQSLFKKIKLMNHITKKKYTTNHKLLILQLPVRRLKQYLFNKIRLPESDKHFSKISGQPLKPDKGSKISLIESYIIANKGLETSLLELLKVRGGNLESYFKMKNKILESGSASVDDVDTPTKPKSVIVLDRYLKAMHLDVGLIK